MSKTKPNAYAWWLSTPKINRHFNNDFDAEYFNKSGLKDKRFPKESYVALAIITSQQSAVDFMKTQNVLTRNWFENYKSKSWHAYNIQHFHTLLEIHKNEAKNRIGLMKINDLLPTLKTQNKIINKYEKMYNLMHRGLVVDGRMISLMADSVKKFELRTTSYKWIKKIQLEKEGKKERDKNEPSCTVKGCGPSAVLKRTNVPSRADITKKQRKHVNIMKYVGNKDEAFGNIFCQQRIIFDINKMKQEMVWILEKSNDAKNKNISVKEHNDKLLNIMTNSIKRLTFWTNKLDDKSLSALRNIIDILTTKPQFIDWILQKLKNEPHDFDIVLAPLAHCLGLIESEKCSVHGTIKSYKRSSMLNFISFL